MKAKDSNVRQALLDRFGSKGTKANPGILYNVSSHIFSALALAVTYIDTGGALEISDEKVKENTNRKDSLLRSEKRKRRKVLHKQPKDLAKVQEDLRERT